MTLTIPGRLPGLNEIIDAAKSHYAKYSTEKKEYTEEVAWLAKQARLPKVEKAYLVITWFEPDRRRDPDNIMAGQKFILDGLVQAGVFPGDSQKYIQGIYHSFAVDPKNPRIEVVIEDYEGGKPCYERKGKN